MCTILQQIILLFDYTVPQPPYPYNKIKANVGSISNKGLEVALGYDVIRSDNSTLTLAGNVSLMKNEVLNLSGSINGSTFKYRLCTLGSTKCFT
jgi:hypothetical protein